MRVQNTHQISIKPLHKMYQYILQQQYSYKWKKKNNCSDVAHRSPACSMTFAGESPLSVVVATMLAMPGTSKCFTRARIILSWRRAFTRFCSTVSHSWSLIPLGWAPACLTTTSYKFAEEFLHQIVQRVVHDNVIRSHSQREGSAVCNKTLEFRRVIPSELPACRTRIKSLPFTAAVPSFALLTE